MTSFATLHFLSGNLDKILIRGSASDTGREREREALGSEDQPGAILFVL